MEKKVWTALNIEELDLRETQSGAISTNTEFWIITNDNRSNPSTPAPES